METIQAFMIVIWFLMKCAGMAVVVVGIYTTVKWFAEKRNTFFSKTEDKDTFDFIDRMNEQIKKDYG